MVRESYGLEEENRYVYKIGLGSQRGEKAPTFTPSIKG